MEKYCCDKCGKLIWEGSRAKRKIRDTNEYTSGTPENSDCFRDLCIKIKIMEFSGSFIPGSRGMIWLCKECGLELFSWYKKPTVTYKTDYNV